MAGPRGGARRPMLVRSLPAPPRRASLNALALFGRGPPPGGKGKGKDGRTFKEQRDAAFGKSAAERIERAMERRKATAQYMKSSKEERRAKREASRPSRKDGPYQDEGKGPFGFLRNGLIIVPQAPFGDPEMDGEERFDLKAKYTDEGYVDENDDGGFSLGRLFGGTSGNKKR